MNSTQVLEWLKLMTIDILMVSQILLYTNIWELVPYIRAHVLVRNVETNQAVIKTWVKQSLYKSGWHLFEIITAVWVAFSCIFVYRWKFSLRKRMCFFKKEKLKIVSALIKTVWHIFEVVIAALCSFRLPVFTWMELLMNLPHISCEV